MDRYWSLSRPLTYTEDVTNKRILLSYFLSKILVFLVTGGLFTFGLTVSSCDGSLVDVVCRLMSANFVYFNAIPVVISSVAVMFVSKYAWNTHTHIKNRNKVHPIHSQAPRTREIGKKTGEDMVTNTVMPPSTDPDPGTCDIAVIRVVRQNEEPYVFFRTSAW